MSEGQVKSKFQWFFIVIFIPAVFAVILAVVLMYYMGINAGGAVREVASVLPFIDSAEESPGEEYSLEDLVARLEHENENFAGELARLEIELENKEEEILRLEEELLLYAQEEEHGEEQVAAEEAVSRQDLRDVVRTLESMTASKAADILEEMSEDEAAGYLRHMNIDSRAQILSRMDPVTAASLVNQLSAE